MWAITLVGTVVGLIVGRGIFVAAHRPLSWAAPAVVAAGPRDPLAAHLARPLGRPVAVPLAFVGIGALTHGTNYMRFYGVDTAFGRRAAGAPARHHRERAR